MTTWNYRVLKKQDRHSHEITYQIHEVYYTKDGLVDCWNHTPVEPLGISESGLRNDLHAFLGALRLPVLEERLFNGKARLVEEKPKLDSRTLQADYASKAARASGYLNQILGNHLLLKQEPRLRQAYDKVDAALGELYSVISQQPEPELAHAV